ncbi:ubiquitin-like protein-NEDD8-like protein RUB3 [Solanum pennellii]|uniref:Ubiquitin-like protein-NEDD8-like protein RUB3 n=1 Tax=Solanum pennellii TaxID=28526 RepID=A0ABM1UZD7_SOLPN|nr:ubiquitin-like protein-NEDD8-like protein RUB3 [Solanum pennellii]
MDLFFYPTKGSSFAIEVGYFDTILEVKEKIQKYQGIPIPKQTLIFKGNILADDLNVHYSDILDRSHIQLVTDFERNKNVVIKSERPKIKLLLKMPTLTKLAIMLKVDVAVSLRRVKERIHEMKGIPMSKLILCVNGVELMDHYRLQDYEFSDNSEIDVSIRSGTIASPPATTTSSESSVNN